MCDSGDAILDSPAMDHMPWILADYPRAKVILTVRDPHRWALRRIRSHRCSAPPFLAWYMPYKSDRCKTPDIIALEHAYIAWYAYIRALCVARSIPLLELNLFRQSDTELWTQLRNFLGATQRVPNTTFGGPMVDRPKVRHGVF
mgnify:CR=1 FL=1